MRIIGLSGPKLAGKGTIAQYLAEQNEAITFSLSSILSDIAKRLYLENTRANLIAIATGLRAEFGETVLAKVLAKDIAESQYELVVIDGIRLQSEVDVFEQLPGFELWYVDTSLQDRYKRATLRGEKIEEKTMSFEQFVAEETAATEKQIASLQARAKKVFINNQGIEDLHRQIRAYGV